MHVGCELPGGLEPEIEWRIFVLQQVAEKVRRSAPLALMVASAFSLSTVRLFFEPRFRPPRFLRSGGMTGWSLKI